MAACRRYPVNPAQRAATDLRWRPNVTEPKKIVSRPESPLLELAGVTPDQIVKMLLDQVGEPKPADYK